LALLINALIKQYPELNRQRITGHCDIASARKIDPGPSFDWEKLSSLLS
jgi:AmpD protein